MTNKDVDALCLHFTLVPAEEMHRLDATNVIPIVRLAGSKRRDAIAAIRAALKSNRSSEERLQQVAWLYCWLTLRGRLQSWTLYRLNSSFAQQFEDFTLFVNIADALRSPGRNHKFVHLSCAHGRYACIMTRDWNARLDQHSVLCFCAWMGMPYLAVRTVGLLNAPELMDTLIGYFRNEERLLGFYKDLRSAFAAAQCDFNQNTTNLSLSDVSSRAPSEVRP